MPLQRYKCHKEVEAFKISRIEQIPILNSKLFDESGESVEVTPEFMNKHNPRPGGYYVRYADGYESYSPAKAFEEGYTKV